MSNGILRVFFRMCFRRSAPSVSSGGFFSGIFSLGALVYFVPIVCCVLKSDLMSTFFWSYVGDFLILCRRLFDLMSASFWSYVGVFLIFMSVFFYFFFVGRILISVSDSLLGYWVRGHIHNKSHVHNISWELVIISPIFPRWGTFFPVKIPG